MIRRVVDQANFQSRPIGKFNHAFEKLSPSSRVLRAVIQIDHQTPHFAKSVADQFPPRAQAVTPEVACFMAAEQQRQRGGGQNQNAEGNQFLFGRRIMVPTFGDLTFTVRSRFFPPTRTRPDRLSPSYRRRSPRFPDRPDSPGAPHGRFQRSRQSLWFSLGAYLSECV